VSQAPPRPGKADRRQGWWTTVRESLSGVEHDYTRGPIDRALVLLAIPMVLEMAMESVFVIADIYFVSSLGAEAVAAVGLTEAVLTLLYAVAIGLGMATTAMISRRVGEGRLAEANVAAGQALWIGVVLSVAVGFAGYYGGEWLLTMMGAEPEVVAIGVGYTSIIFGGAGTIIFLFMINAIFRGAGDPMIAMRALWLANGVNLVLDPLLIFGLGPIPAMGVEGAAIATTIGRGTGVAYQLWCLFGANGRVRPAVADLRLNPSVLLRLLRLSAGGVMQFLIHTASWVVLVRIIALYGSVAVAGYTIAIRIIDFTIMPAWGLGNAASTLVGQNLGADRPDRAERSAWRAVRANVWFLCTAGLLFVIFADALVGIFTDDPLVARYGADALRIIALGYPVYAVGMTMVQSFNGAGDTDTPMKINFFVYWVFQIPLAWLLAQQLGQGPYGAFYAILAAEGLLALVGTTIFRRGHWRQRKV
jgi:putative MATE family efflux protein